MKLVLTGILDKLPNTGARVLIAVLIVVAVVFITVAIPLSNNFTSIYMQQQEFEQTALKQDQDRMQQTITVLEASLYEAYSKMTTLEEEIQQQQHDINILNVELKELSIKCLENNQ